MQHVVIVDEDSKYVSKNYCPLVLDVTDTDFNVQVVQRSFKKPLLVDFWASWCVPCRQLTPVLERIVLEQDSPVMLTKLNTEHNPQTAQAFGIQGFLDPF